MSEIDIERKREIIANVDYAINKYIDKKDLMADALGSLDVSEDERTWFYATCFGTFDVGCSDFS